MAAAVKSIAVSSPIIANQPNNNTFYKIFGNGYDYLEFDTIENINKAVRFCPPVLYLPIKTAKAICKGKVSLVNTITGQTIDKDVHKYLDILKRPNYSQAQHQFITQIIVSTMLRGYTVCIRPISVGFDKADSNTIWALPFTHVEITWKINHLRNAIYSTDIMEQIQEIRFDGKAIPKDQCYIIPDLTYYSNSLIIPESRLKALTATINNLTVNLKARGKMMNSPMGILSMDEEGNLGAGAMKKEERARLEQEFEKDYGFDENQRKIMVASTSVNWQQMGYAIAQMQFVELEKSDMNMFSEVFDYKAELTAQYGNSNVSERNSAETSWYSDTIIPYAEHIYQNLTEWLIGTGTTRYNIDFSHVPALQKNKKEAAEVFSKYSVSGSLALQNGLITYGQCVELLGEVPNPKWANLYFYQLPIEIQENFRSNNTQQNQQDTQK
jgi:HK97 family phage portal protein